MRLLLGLVAAVVLGACGPAGQTQVSFVSNERPTAAGAPAGLSQTASVTNPNGVNTDDLEEDELVEPEHPMADTKQERALVHIHGPNPKDVCSGVVVAPKLVATAQRCLKGIAKGASALDAEHAYRVEVASSTLTWTNRKVKYAVLPQCDESEIDIAILVLEEAAPVLAVPLKVVSAPNTGARIQALGFGQCPGSKKTPTERVGTVRSRVAQAIVIDVPLCKGDVGGPVTDGRDGDVIGLISHHDNPEGSPLKTTTIARLDSTWARKLLDQAKTLGDGGDPKKLEPVSCK